MSLQDEVENVVETERLRRLQAIPEDTPVNEKLALTLNASGHALRAGLRFLAARIEVLEEGRG